MRLPRALAWTNRVFTNRLAVPVARRAAGLGVVHHVGRRSGRVYSTPVRVLVATDEHVAIPAAYGLARGAAPADNAVERRKHRAAA